MYAQFTSCFYGVWTDLIQPLNLGAGENVKDDIFGTLLKYDFQNSVFRQIRKPVLHGVLENECSENFRNKNLM